MRRPGAATSAAAPPPSPRPGRCPCAAARPHARHESGDACIEVHRPKSSQHAEPAEDSRPLTVPAPAWAAFVAGLRATA
ncbi:DUF397 domain-containing protein [Streptomyces sp. ET3-23]|nr:DUF397 domain-containing protein [Streptomyces sp. ET3-23]